MDESECGVWCCNNFIIVLFSSLACIAAIACVELVDAIEFGENEEESKNWWIVFTVFLNSIVIAILTKFFGRVVRFIVERENHS